MTSHRYGEITGKYVIYPGESGDLEDIQYLNVEEYLKSLLFSHPGHFCLGLKFCGSSDFYDKT